MVLEKSRADFGFQQPFMPRLSEKQAMILVVDKIHRYMKKHATLIMIASQGGSRNIGQDILAPSKISLAFLGIILKGHLLILHASRDICFGAALS
jgi:hypothetical protein